MATVDLDDLWLHKADDLSDNLVLPVASIVDNSTRTVEVRQYADGRQRAIRTPSRPRKVDVSLEWVARADVDQLDAWLGELLLFRDPRGRKLYGVYKVLEVTELTPTDVADVSLSFVEVTDSEEV